MATCGGGHQQLWPAYIGGRVGIQCKNRYKHHSMMRKIMLCGDCHVYVVANMAITTTCGESHQQEWPAYIAGLGEYKNRYTWHSLKRVKLC